MTIAKHAIALAATAGLLAAVAPSSARSAEPTIYYFSASECDFCANGLSFLQRWKAADSRLRFQTFDIVASPDDATAFVRVVGAIGLSDPRVPMTIVGHHVFIGYEGDETTGDAIKFAVGQCREKECTDIVRGILTIGAEAVKAPDGWVVHQRFAKAAMSK